MKKIFFINSFTEQINLNFNIILTKIEDKSRNDVSEIFNFLASNLINMIPLDSY